MRCRRRSRPKSALGDVSTPEEDKALADLTTAINALDASVS
jgi:hypothetical protein